MRRQPQSTSRADTKTCPNPMALPTMLSSSSQARMQALASTAKQTRLFTALILQRKIRKFFQSPRRFAINRTHSPCRARETPRQRQRNSKRDPRNPQRNLRSPKQNPRNLKPNPCPKPNLRSLKQNPRNARPGPTLFKGRSPQTVSLFANAMHGARSIIIPSETYEGF